MTIGQEFHAFAASLESEIGLLRDAEKYLYAGQHGCHCHRHWHQRSEGLRAEDRAASGEAHRKPIVVAPDMVAQRGTSRDSSSTRRR
jgi:hypothetical protein